MSASHAPALDAIAFQLVVALDRYEADTERMVDTWLDMELYGSVSDQVEQIRMYSITMPELAVFWVELLIAHAELVHSLWRLRFRADEANRERIGQLHQRHASCVASLKGRVLRVLCRSDSMGG